MAYRNKSKVNRSEFVEIEVHSYGTNVLGNMPLSRGAGFPRVGDAAPLLDTESAAWGLIWRQNATSDNFVPAFLFSRFLGYAAIRPNAWSSRSVQPDRLSRRSQRRPKTHSFIGRLQAGHDDACFRARVAQG